MRVLWLNGEEILFLMRETLLTFVRLALGKGGLIGRIDSEDYYLSYRRPLNAPNKTGSLDSVDYGSVILDVFMPIASDSRAEEGGFVEDILMYSLRVRDVDCGRLRRWERIFRVRRLRELMLSLGGRA
jgi:hypothetical protein